ncbi:4c2db6b6-49bb-4660-b602-14764f04f563 [Thermothielavioides terrestris]|nr:4c2db6b6-49bb-4660-b602-14764f04f563 [Thermothielavioides terrestris]
MPANFAPGPNGAPAPCPIFIKSFLSDPTFKQCYPLSMLFDSKSFFEAQKSLVGITRTLDATCAANATFCSQYLAQLAQKLIEDDNCGADYKSGQATVVDAYNEMMAYAPVYSAGCLKDPNTGAYCYANAVTNQTNPSSAYFYFLPLNQSLPGTTVPACNDCLKQTMAIYQAATADRRQLIVNTYVAAAKQVNTVCGPGFVNESLAAEVIPSAAVLSRPSTWLAAALPLLVVTLWLV